MPAAVYWRRRLIALAAVLVVAWLVLRVIDGESAPPAEPDVAPAPVAPAVVPTDGEFDAELAPSASPCDPQLVRVTPTVPLDQSAGKPVTINLVMSSTDPAPCTLQPADADVLAVISTNGVPLWDSTVCSGSLMTKPAQLAGGGWATVVSTTWSGRVSGGSCADSESFADAGRYSVQVGTLGGEPGQAVFELS